MTVGLALFNRRRGRLFLGETGDRDFDLPAVEHNGPIVTRDRPDAWHAILDAVARRHDLVLGGLSRPAGGLVVKSQPAPFARLDGDWIARRSANTRQQIRRADRGYAAFGPIRASRAATEDEAHAGLEDLATLHQAAWTGRGRPGAFATPFFARFHHALIHRGFPRAEIDLWRIAAGPRPIGLLYNFRFRSRISAYQSGFAYDPSQPRLKPGLTCHRQAIEQGMADGLSVYDFLAGDDRYKRSLADESATMRWILAGPVWSPRLLAARTRAILAGMRDSWRSRT